MSATPPRPTTLPLRSGCLVTFIDEPPYWLHLAPTGSFTGSRIVDAVFESPATSPRPAALKLATDPVARTRLRAERAAYDRLSELTIEPQRRDAARPAILEVLAYRSTAQRDLLVLERGIVSLDRFVAREKNGPDFGLIEPDIVSALTREFAILTAAAIVRTLSAIDEHPSTALTGHGDIRLENLLLVDRGGVLDVVLADWGSDQDETVRAPEQRSRAVAMDTTTDLWGAALALWELFHAGQTPYRDDYGTPIRRGDPRLASLKSLTLVLDDCATNPSCTCGPTTDAAHLLATGILAAGDDRDARRAVLSSPDPLGRYDDLRARLIDEAAQLRSEEAAVALREHPTEGLLRRIHYSDVASSLDSDRGWVPASPVSHGSVQQNGRRGVRWRARMRRLLSLPSLLGFVRALAVGAGVAIGVTLLALLPLVALPTAVTDLAQAVVVAGAALLGGAALILLTVRRRRLVPRGVRSTRSATWPPLAVVAAAAISSTVSALAEGSAPWQLPDQGELALVSRILIAGGSAVLAVGLHGFVVGRVDYNPTLRRRLRGSTRAQVVTSAVAVAVALVLAAATLVPGPPASATPAVSVETVAEGIPDGVPVFSNPDDIAIGLDGSIAVLERYADQWDVVWMRSPDGRWREVLRVTAVVSSTAAASPGFFERGIHDFAGLLAPLVRDARASIPEGDPLTAISALAVLPSGELVVLGPEGVTRVTLGGPHPVAATITSSPRVDRFSREGEIRVVDGTVYVSDFDQEEFASAHLEVMSEWTPLFGCAELGSYDPAEPQVVTVALDGSVDFPVWKDVNGNQCLRDVFAVAASDDGPQFLEWSRASGQWAAWLRAPGAEAAVQLTQGDDSTPNDPVISGERLFASVGDCLRGYPLTEDVDFPLVVDRSWYSPGDEQECLAVENDGGFIGGSIATEATAAAPGADGSSSPESEVQVRPSCEPPSSGRSSLDLYSWKQNPTALGPDGTVYIVADAGYRCTSIVWMLGPADTEWTPVPGYASSTDDSSASLRRAPTMMAGSPAVDDGLVTWMVEGRWRVLDEDGNNRSPRVGPTSSYRSLSSEQVVVPGVTVALSVPYEKYLPELARTKLVLAPDEGTTVEVMVPNATGLARWPHSETGDDSSTVIIATCEAILSFDASIAPGETIDPEGEGARWWVPAASDFAVLAGFSGQGGPAVSPESDVLPCSGESSEAPRDAHSGTDVPLFPRTVDAATVGSDVVVAFGEVGVFGGIPVSRIRVIDPSTTDEVVRTVGCIDSDPVYDGSCSGDIGSLGLEARDIAVRGDGTIAVATVSATGPGPVLLFAPDGTRSILPTAPSVLPNGVAWDGSVLIVTDASRGDVLAYTFAGEAAE